MRKSAEHDGSRSATERSSNAEHDSSEPPSQHGLAGAVRREEAQANREAPVLCALRFDPPMEGSPHVQETPLPVYDRSARSTTVHCLPESEESVGYRSMEWRCGLEERPDSIARVHARPMMRCRKDPRRET